jgi:hypothetical protein
MALSTSAISEERIGIGLGRHLARPHARQLLAAERQDMLVFQTLT